MAITKRLDKGTALTHGELDGNFTDLDGRVTTLETADTNKTQVTNSSIGALSDVDITGVTANSILKYNASTSKFEIAGDATGGGGGGFSSLVQDTTPQLGGVLDANGQNIDMGVNFISDTKVGQWDTAYSWGDHSLAGYTTNVGLENIVEDVTPQLGGALDANGNDIYLNTGRLSFAPGGVVSYLDFTVNQFGQNNNVVLSSVKSIALFLDSNGGDSNQAFRIFNDTNPDGSFNENTYIFKVDESGDTFITGTLNGHTIPGGAGTLALTSDLSGLSYLQNVVDDTTPQLGGALDTNGNNITFSGSDKAQFGSAQDLSIFHNGNHSIIRETGTGSLYLQSDNNVILSTDSGTKKMVKGVGSGEVVLYHNDVQKLNTSSSGVTVVDEVHTEGATPHLTLKRTDNANVPTIRFKGSGGVIGASIDFQGTAGTSNELAFQVYDGATIAERFRVTYTGAKITGTLNGHTIPGGAGTLALLSDINNVTNMSSLSDVDSVDTVASGDFLLYDGSSSEYKFVAFEAEVNGLIDSRTGSSGHISTQSQYAGIITTDSADPTDTAHHILGNTGSASVHNASTGWYYGDVVSDPANPTTSVVLDIDQQRFTGAIQSDSISVGSGGGITAQAGATLDFQGTTINFGSATIMGGNAFNDTINNHLWSGSTQPTNGYVLSWNTALLGGSGDYEWVAQSGGGTTWATLGDKDGAGGPAEIILGQNAVGGIESVSIGKGAHAGDYGQAIGNNAGNTGQGQGAVALGSQAGETSQEQKAIAIGNYAGQTAQGGNAIAIGEAAGRASQTANSIIINATGVDLNNTVPNTFTVKPIRNAPGAQALYYDPTSGEVTYDVAGGGTTFGLAGNTGTHTFNTATETLTFLGTTGQINAGIAANNVTLELDPNINSIVSISFEGSTANANETKLQATDPTADRTINLPDATGHLAVFTTAPTAAIADGTIGQVLTTDGAGGLSFTTVSGGGGSGTPGGSATQVQFNDSGSFGGDAGMTYNKTSNALTVGSVITDSIETATTGTPTITSASNIVLNPTGSVVVQSGGFRLANMDTTARNALTASNGEMIYNTTVNKLQAYQNGAWINIEDGSSA